jgi:hypothetical protein
VGDRKAIPVARSLAVIVAIAFIPFDDTDFDIATDEE